MRSKAIALLLGALSLLVLGVGCVSTGQPTATPSIKATAAPGTTPAAAGEEPKYGGWLIDRTNDDPPHLDPQQVLVHTLHQYGASQSWSTLLRYDYGSKVGPLDATVVGDLAESWQQPEPLVFVFKLRQGVKYHDIPPVNGRELTAEDVVYSYNRQSTKGWQNSEFLAMVDKWEAPDKYTVKATLKKPDAAFLVTLASGYNKIIAKEVVEEKGDLKQGPVIGTGAFIFEKWEPKAAIHIKKNPNYYHKGKPYVEGVTTLLMPDDSTAQAAFRTGKLDIFPTQKVTADTTKKTNPEVALNVSAGSFSGHNLVFNTKKPPFNDERVRDAISIGIDRKQIMDTVYFGEWIYTMGIALPGSDWQISQEDLAKSYTRDVAKAKQLLAEAGITGYTGELTLAYTYSTYSDAGEVLQSQLKDIGFNMTIKNVDSPTYVSKILPKGWDGDIYYGPLGLAPDATADLMQMYHSTGSRNSSGHNDPKLDKMIEDQAGEMNLDKRKAMLLEIQRYIQDKNYRTMTGAAKGFTLIQPWLKGRYFSFDSRRNRWWEEAWLDPAKPRNR